MRDSLIKKITIQRLAREEFEDGIPVPVEVPMIVDGVSNLETDTTEYDVAATEEELKVMQADNQTVAAVTEALEDLATTVRVLIDNGQCTGGTLALLHLAGEQYVSQLGERPVRLSFESLDTASLERQHELALEGFFENVGQSYVMSVKHHVNAVKDFFKGTSGKIKKYATALNDAEREYEQTKSHFAIGPYEGSLNDLWYFFSTTAGMSKKILVDLKDDVAFSRYALVTYPEKVLDTAHKLTGMIKSGKLDSLANVQKLAKQVEGLSSGFDLFDSKLAKTASYFNAVTLGEDSGSATKPLTIGNTTYDKLAGLATSRAWVEQGSTTHSAKKAGAYIGSAVAHGVIAGAIGTVGVAAAAGTISGATTALSSMANRGASSYLTPQFDYSASDIATVIAGGKAYLDNVEHYLKLDHNFETSADAFVGSLSALSKTVNHTGGDKETVEAAKKLMRQLDKFGTNLLFENFCKPAVAEIARSIKGGKYCMYLGKRMIYNATVAEDHKAKAKK